MVIGNKTWTCKVWYYSVLSGACLPIPAHLLLKISFTHLIDTIYPRNDLNVHDLHQQSLKLSCLPIPVYLFARDKTWTYNLNIFSVPLYQIELLELVSTYNVEKPGIEPKLTIRKIVVLPFKLYPPRYLLLIW